MANG
jgi:serine/threonine protein kinase